MPTKQEVRDELRAVVEEFLDSVSAEELSSLQASGLREALAREASRQQMFASRFGPFLSTARVERLLGVTRQAISKKVAKGQLLRATTTDGKAVYPRFQFVGQGISQPLLSVARVLREGGLDEWSILYWLTAPQPELHGLTPAQAALAAEPPADLLLRMAREDAGTWADADRHSHHD